MDVDRVWQLDPGARVTGAALGAGGTPAAGVLIEVLPVGPHAERGGASCVTDEDGRFSCLGLKPGDYDVQAAGVPPRTDAVRVQLSFESSPDVTLRMHPLGALHVRMLGGEGFDPRTFSVIASRPNQSPLWGELRGEAFVFDPVPLGSYEVLCDSVPGASAQRVTLTRDREIATISLALPELQSLEGRVIDDAGQAVPDVWVRAARVQKFTFAEPTEAALTEGDGGFVLDGLVPGAYTLVVSGGEGEGRLDGVASGSTNVVVPIQRFGSLSGSLHDVAGARVPDFVVIYPTAHG